MKKVILISIITFAIGISTFSQTTNGAWIGKYSYEMPGPVTFFLTIKADNTITYEGGGVQTYFVVQCKGKVNGDKYDIYFVKTTEGGYLSEDWIDKTKPIITLSYTGNVLYTYEPQHDFDKKGAQITYVKIY